MIKVINVRPTDIQNGKQALLCLLFVYLRLCKISLFRLLLLNDEYILLIAAEIDSSFLSRMRRMQKVVGFRRRLFFEVSLVCPGLWLVLWISS